MTWHKLGIILFDTVCATIAYVLALSVLIRLPSVLWRAYQNLLEGLWDQLDKLFMKPQGTRYATVFLILIGWLAVIMLAAIEFDWFSN